MQDIKILIYNITEKDKKHQESRICDGSIGHIEVVDGLKVLNIYRAHWFI